MGSLISEIPQSEVNATLELLDRLGVSRDDLKRFRKSSDRVKGEVAKLIKGQGTGAHVIDCDSNPFTPEGWMVVKHHRGGQLTFDPLHIKLYLDDGQKGGKYIEGNELRQRLADKSVLNANVLDYLLANPNLIPDWWEANYAGHTRRIYFWGTEYLNRTHHRRGGLCVRCLHWSGSGWSSDSGWLSDVWDRSDPAAVRAS